MYDFIGIDFETATTSRDSACSIGLAVVKNGEVEVHHHLIRPPSLDFDPHCARIHGITPDMVRNAPTFEELYPEIEHLMQGDLWAHNASFERKVLGCLAHRYNLTLPTEVDCTLQLSRRLFPKLGKHGLNVVSEHLGLTFQHHHAGEDAWASAQIVLHARKLFESGEWNDPVFHPWVVPDGVKDHSFALMGDFEFGSYDDVIKAMKICGASIERSIKRSTPYLVVGEAKAFKNSPEYAKALKFIKNGGAIRLVKESQFWEALREERGSGNR